MVLLRIIKREKMLALSNRAVLCLAFIMVLWAMALILGTCAALYEAGYWWLILAIASPLGAGLGRGITDELRYCRPDWFKPDPADHQG